MHYIYYAQKVKESGSPALSIPFRHFPDRNTTLQPRNGPRSVEVAELSSRGHVGVVQYSAGASTYKGVLMCTEDSQMCNCALAS